MNISNLATGFAGLGLAAAVNLKYGQAIFSPLAQWRSHCIMGLSGAIGTSLSLLQCAQEGRNISSRTITILVTNACILSYSCLKSLTDLKNACLEDFLIFGDLSSPYCRPFLDGDVLNVRDVE
ncbi:hypothetical protein [Endozoicomonas sp. ONNA2]|uniref:hypothetical protein n=1 Tax=Endozoicomonas sp. ONNA2 TaxID=2828741 RepID=UPI002147BB92|nr:hypothetical protein [Endozoicomonas sp. ONNA2]